MEIIIFSAYLLFFGIYLLLLIRRRNKRRHIVNRCYDDLLNGLKSSCPIDNNDMRYIYSRLNKHKHFESYATFLQDFLIHTRELPESEFKDLPFEEINKKLKAIIVEERTAKPYEGVNENDRHLLLAVEKVAPDNPTFKSNLEDLASSIITKQDSLNKAERVNRWTIPISIIGVLVSVLMFFLGSTRLSEKDMNVLNDNMKQIVSEQLDSLSMSMQKYQ